MLVTSQIHFNSIARKLFTVFCLINIFYQISAFSKPKIAFLMRLSEESYSFTREIKKGFLHHPKASQYEIKFISHEGDSKSIAEATKNLKESTYDLIIGGETSKTAIILTSILNDVPIISPTATSPRITENSKNIFPILALDDEVVDKLSEFIESEFLEGKKIGLIHNISYPNTDFIGNRFIQQMNKRKVPLKIVELQQGTTITSQTLAPLIKSEVDVVITFTFRKDFREIHHTLLKNSIFPTYIGGDGWGSNQSIHDTIQKNDTNFKAIKYSYWDQKNCNSPKFASICESFKLKYNTQFNEFSAIGYDLHKYLDDIWSFETNSPRKNAKSFDWLTSKSFSIKSDGTPEKEFFFYKFENGERKILNL